MQTAPTAPLGRFLEMALALTHAGTGATLLSAGGVWDCLDRRCVATTPGHVVRIAMEPSQAPFVEWFGGQVADARERRRRNVHLALLAADRRSGQTFSAVVCLIAALLEVPRTTGGAPSLAYVVAPSYREREEILPGIRGLVPREWFVERWTPDWCLMFRSGGILRLLAGDDADLLKQGRMDWCLFTGGAPAARAAANALRGVSDSNGLTIIEGTSAPHAHQLAEVIDAGRAPGAIRFGAPRTGA